MCFPSKVGSRCRFQLSVELISPNDGTPISIIFYYYDWGFLIANEDGPFIVDLPIKDGGSFHSYVNVYQRVIWEYRGMRVPSLHSLSIPPEIARHPLQPLQKMFRHVCSGVAAQIQPKSLAYTH